MESTFSAAERPAQRGHPEGGFALVLVWQLCRVWDRYKRGELRFADVRLWLALREAQERRCGLEEGRAGHYTPRELERLTGDSARTVRASLRRLAEQGLATFETSAIYLGSRRLDPSAEPSSLASMLGLVENHRRAVPIPRRTLRMLAQCGRPAVVAAALGHLFRCVYYRGGQVVSWGRCKSSWVADAFGVDERSIKAARSHLLSVGWLVKLKNRGAAAVKRWGGEYQVELQWERPSSYAGSGFSPGQAEIGTGFSPRNNQTPLSSREIKNQTLVCTEQPGVKTAGEGAVGKKNQQGGEPSMRHLVREDLTCTRRTLYLFEQAADLGLIGKSEHGRLVFVALAEHALVHGTRNPCGLFVKLLREKRFNYVTQDDEDAARCRINQTLYQVDRVWPEKPKVPARRADLPKEAKLAQAIEKVSAEKRLAPITVIRAMKLDWTLERYQEHLQAAEDHRLGGLLQSQPVPV